MSKKLVVFSILGVQLDDGASAGRWQKWRPTVSLGMFEDISVARLELLADKRRSGSLLQVVTEDLKQVSPETSVNLQDLYFPDPWDFEQVYAKLFDLIRQYPFDTEREEYWIHITTGTHVAQICWFLLAEARFIPAKLVQTSPPRKQKQGDPGSYTLIDLDLQRYNQIAQRFESVTDESTAFLKSGIATKSDSFNRMIEQIERVAGKSKAPMLLMGPTGAGKSQLARNVFELKKQRQGLAGSFVEVNCATLRGDGAGSALFGHVRGAFTGAASDRAGLLKSADRGLLFLDEIGELGLDEQAMLLRAIEDKRFPPLGGDKEVHSDFQLIAGTNRDLSAEVQAGKFRDDLFARLNLWTFQLPGLKQRSEDIEPNLDFELARYERQYREKVRFNSEARARFIRFARSEEAHWPGNFRDLGASVMRMATLADRGKITLDVTEEEISRLQQAWRGIQNKVQASDDLESFLSESQLSQLDLFDRPQLSYVISVCKRSRSISEAGRLLFAVSRTQKSSSNDSDRLRKYLARFELSFEQLR